MFYGISCCRQDIREPHPQPHEEGGLAPLAAAHAPLDAPLAQVRRSGVEGLRSSKYSKFIRIAFAI